MTHDYHRTAEAQREDDAEFGNSYRSEYTYGVGPVLVLALSITGFGLLALSMWGLWMASK